MITRKYISVGFGSEKLRERNKVLSALIDINDIMSSCLGPGEVLESALTKVMEHFNFTAGRIYLMDKGGCSLTLAVSKDMDTREVERIRITEGCTGMAARTRSFIAQHVGELQDRERAALLLRKGLKVVVCVPLIHLDRVLGVMNLGADKSLRLSEATIDFLVLIGNTVAVALHHSKLCENLGRHIQELKEKNETIEFFTYTASHDIKSPLIGIHGLTRLLGLQYRDLLDERGKSYCDQILKASEQVVALVDSINTYVKSKEAFHSMERISLLEILQCIRTELADELMRHRVKWIQPEILPEIIADKTGIQRVFQNLVQNALK